MPNLNNACIFRTSQNLRNLYDSLPAEAQEGIDKRAQEWAIVEDAEKMTDLIDQGQDLPSYSGLSVGWRHTKKALNEALDQVCDPSAPEAPEPPHRPWERPGADPTPAYPRARILANFLFDQGNLGTPVPKHTLPAGLDEVVIHPNLANEPEVAILVSPDPVATPMGPAKEFWVSVSIGGMVSEPEVKYYGPFDTSILPNE